CACLTRLYCSCSRTNPDSDALNPRAGAGLSVAATRCTADGPWAFARVAAPGSSRAHSATLLQKCVLGFIACSETVFEDARQRRVDASPPVGVDSGVPRIRALCMPGPEPRRQTGPK